MNRADFDAHVAAQVARTADLLIKKGDEYAGDVDRLANFKRNAEKNGQTVLECWQVYYGKHIDSVASYMQRVKEQAIRLALQEVVFAFEKLKDELPRPGARSDSDKAKMAAVIDPAQFRRRVNEILPEAICIVDSHLSEPIESRFDDIINYCFLGSAILAELKNSGKE